MKEGFSTTVLSERTLRENKMSVSIEVLHLVELEGDCPLQTPPTESDVESREVAISLLSTKGSN